MYGYDTQEWATILVLTLAAFMIITVFIYEMWSAYKAKKAFDEKYEAIYLLRHPEPRKSNDVDLAWGTIENGDVDYSNPKDRVYDWKKDAPNDFS